jgi:methylmalonyl-CoA/ethylmalonyl-CoA epimerase
MTPDVPRPDYQLDHVCLAVRKLAPARAMLEKMFGYRPRTEPVHNTRQKVNVQFLSKPGSLDIKLIEPDSPQSPLVEFIKTRGGGLHHLAFRTGSVEEGVADLTAKQARVLSAPAPGEAFDDETIAFLFAGMGLNAELIDTDRRRAEISPK